MTQQRLSNLMVLHVHKDITDSMNVANVGNSEDRLRIFGHFNFSLCNVLSLSCQEIKITASILIPFSKYPGEHVPTDMFI